MVDFHIRQARPTSDSRDWFLLNFKIQYRSKVSYHLSFRVSRDATLVSRDESLASRDESLASRDEILVSRDEILVSRDSVKRTFWNKLQAISLWEND